MQKFQFKNLLSTEDLIYTFSKKIKINGNFYTRIQNRHYKGTHVWINFSYFLIPFEDNIERLEFYSIQHELISVYFTLSLFNL